MTTLAHVVTVRERFARSANVERDVGGVVVEGYVPTARTLDVIQRIAAGIAVPSAGRAISITGPYGSGKSSLALFLDALLSPVTESFRGVADRILREADVALAHRLAAARAALGADAAGFVRATATAQREPVVATILRALQGGVVRHFPRAVIESTPDLRRVLGVDVAASLTAAQVRELVAGVARMAPVLLVIDEFGKNLEHVVGSAHVAADDLYVLQDLAEWASGPQPLPLILVTLQHLAFDDYAASATAAQRREWSKVLGRFIDIPYVETPAQAQALIASVFEPTREESARSRIEAWANQVQHELDVCGLGASLFVDPAECYPLHPLVVAALPDLCARYGQNERTLFSFLAGPEPLSVRTYLVETEAPADDPLPSIRLDRVYDYFLESAPSMVGAAATASRWLEIEVRIRDIVGLPEPDKRVLKTVGVLNLISAGGALRATRQLLAFAAADGQPGTEHPNAVGTLITDLERRGLLTYREFADELRIWSGSDFDLKGAVEAARRRLRQDSVASVLQHVRPLAPLVAARHSQQTGTLRVFERRYVDRGADAIRAPTDASFDGIVALSLDGSVPETDHDDWPVVVGVAEGIGDIATAALELAAHLDVLQSVEMLGTDWVARRELRERAAAATVTLDQTLDRAFGPTSRSVQWWLASPSKRTRLSSGNLSAILSDLCDQRYRDAPILRNEMLARRELTSQGAKARGELLAAMVEHGHADSLGLTGYGPERAMYEAILRRPGIHRSGRLGWQFGPPPPGGVLRFGPAWAALRRGFRDATTRHIPLDDLLHRLTAPPLGLKAGPLPVLLTAALLARAEDVALYEEGTFVPRLTVDVVNRLAKNPDRFAVKSFATRGERAKVIAAVARALGVTPRSGTRLRVASVIAVVSPLLTRARALNTYARRTRLGQPQMLLAVRAALFNTREPDELLFAALPQALGFEPFLPQGRISPERVQAFAEALSVAMDNLGNLYPALLAEVGRLLEEALGFDRREARARAGALVGRVLDPQLRSFVNALADEHLEADEWVQYVATVVTGNPPATWTDDDRGRYAQLVGHLSAAYRRVESLHYRGRDLEITRDGFRALMVGVTLPDGSGAERVVAISEASEELLERLTLEAVERFTHAFGPSGAELLLARVAQHTLLRPASDEIRESGTMSEEQRYG